MTEANGIGIRKGVRHARRLARARARHAVVLAGLFVAGCSGMSRESGSAFVDPARYDLYRCDQLARERETVLAREVELRGLMNRAQDDGAGSLMAELGYGADYSTTRGRMQLVDEQWRQKRCEGEASPRPPAGIPRTE